MFRFQFQKLVRDDFLEFAQKRGARNICHRYLSDSKHVAALKQKLVEEAMEVADAASLADLEEEIADVLEVLAVLIEKAGLSPTEIEKRQRLKVEERGSFRAGLYLETYDVPAEDKELLSLMRGAPDKYPETKIPPEEDSL